MFFEQPGREWDVTRQSKLASVAVVSVSFKPSGASTKDARGRGIGVLLLFAQCPRASFVLVPLGLKETETTATQGKSKPKMDPDNYVDFT